MRHLSQILLLGTSLVAVVCAGLFFEIVFDGVGSHFRFILEGKPLPAILELLASGQRLALVLMMLPWFVLTGLPLLTHAASQKYFDAASFSFRFLAFLLVEGFLVLFFALVLWVPFSSIYLSGSPTLTGPKVPAGWMLLVCFSFLLVGVGARRSRLR